MKWIEHVKRMGVKQILKSKTALTLRDEQQAASKKSLQADWKHLIASQLSNCKELDTHSLIALAVAMAQEIQNSLFLGSVARAPHEAGHAGAYINTFDDVLFNRDVPVDIEDHEGQTFNDLLKKSIVHGAFKIPISRHGVSVRLWNIKRLLETNLPSYGVKEPWKEQADHRIQILWPIPVIWVISGNHSFTAGILNKSGHVDVGGENTVLQDISPLYEKVYCDGAGMRRLGDNTPLERLQRNPLHWDVRWGLLFELGRIIAARRGWIPSMDEWCKEGL
jgi:hypothetical protein